jgi:hypothetical protein
MYLFFFFSYEQSSYTTGSSLFIKRIHENDISSFLFSKKKEILFCILLCIHENCFRNLEQFFCFFFCRNNSSIDQKFIFTIIKNFFFFPFFSLFLIVVVLVRLYVRSVTICSLCFSCCLCKFLPLLVLTYGNH